MPKAKSELSMKLKRFARSGSCRDSDSDSGTVDDPLKIVPADSDDINRWICMMNESKDVNVAFLHILKEIEENIIERIDIFQKDLESKIEMKFNAPQKPTTVFSNANIKELKKELGVSFPIKDIDEFESFDNSLDNDSNKMDALRELLLHQIDRTSAIAKDVYTILKFVMEESVLIQFTCVGKKFRGQRKKSFCSTNVYLCMEDVLSHKHKQPSNDLKLTNVLSNYFSRINFKNKTVPLNDNSEE